VARLHRAGQRHADGVDAAQRLEGAEAEALALVLHAQLADAELRRHRRQGLQGRRLVHGAGGEALQQLGHAVGVDHVSLLGPIGPVAPRAGISGDPVLGHDASNEDH